MNELGIILHNQTIWITKSQLIIPIILAFMGHILIIIFQPDRKVTTLDFLRVDLTTIWAWGLILFLYLSF